jgi:hypothetical protein
MKLMNKEELVSVLCAGYCSFYKPGKDEDLACKGFYILKKLIEQGKEVPVRMKKIILSMTTEDDLFQIICRGCPFVGQDCDFAAWKRGERRDVAREAVNPCGGFLCLGHCIDQGTVDIEDINRLI